MEYWKEELYHHGIRGQKWGVRNGPPYPLRPGAHSRSEEKAGWKNSLAGGFSIDEKTMNSLIFAGKAAATIGIAYLGVKTINDFGILTRPAYFMDAYQAIKDSKIETTLLRDIVEKGTPTKTLTNNTIDDNFKYINDTSSSASVLKAASLDPRSLSEKDIENVMSDQMAGRLTNCTFSTCAGVLREKGYDVKAGDTMNGRTIAHTLMFYKDSEFTSVLTDKKINNKNILSQGKFMMNAVHNPMRKSNKLNDSQVYIDKLTAALKSQGDGSYGELFVFGDTITQAHSVEYKIVNNVPHVIDNQLKMEFNSIDDYFKSYASAHAKNSNVIKFNPALTLYRDLTNAEPNFDVLISQGIVIAR